MDLCKDESPVAVAQQKAFPIKEKPRPVLVTSEKNNAVPANGKPRAREIMPRYKSGITSAPRSPSPKSSRTSTTSRTAAPQRAQSAERRPSTPSSPSLRRSAPSSPKSRHSPPSTPLSKSCRPSSPSSMPSTPSSPSSRSTTPVRDSMVERLNSSRRSLVGRAPDGLWPSIRSLSASFQSESSSVLTNKSVKHVRSPSPDRTLKSSQNAALEMKRTPLRGRNASDQSENSRLVENPHVRTIDQLRWPGMIGGKASSNVLSTRSMDLTDKISRSSSSSIAVRGFSPSRGMPSTDSERRCLKNSANEAARLLPSDEGEKGAVTVSLARNVISFTLETAPSRTRPRRSPSHVPSFVPSSPNKAASSLVRPSSPNKAASSLVRPSSPNRAASSLVRPSSPNRAASSLVRPSSPNKATSALSSTSKGLLSPTRTRPSTPSSPSRTRPLTPLSPSRARPSSPCSSFSNTATQIRVSSSIFNYIADVQKGKRNPNHIEDSHQLRLLHNRDLQWRFVNARADASFSNQKLIAEGMFFNVWNITSELRDSVIRKRIDVQNLRQEMILKSVLTEQITYLENWSALDAEHSISLLGTIEALKASTLRLPVTGGARADVRSVKNAISSAVDVMQAMGSSICYLLSRVEGTNSLVTELSQVAATESIMLDECRELLSLTAAMQVHDCSLGTHLIQSRQDVHVAATNR